MENRILFMGMYDSGKTTFIACLWDYINSGKSNKTLTLSTLANTENEYLDKIRSEWLQCYKVTRTYMVNKTEKVIMRAKNVLTGENVAIEIPDISGELFNSHFQVREWSQDFESMISNLNGVVLFINPTDIKNRTQFVADANNIEDDIVSSIVEKTEGSDGDKIPNTKNVSIERDNAGKNSSPKIEFVNWSEEHTANQVKLVENLQFMEFRNAFKNKVKISVVVSCWDLIESSNDILPEVWVQQHLPLLHQYLHSNDQLFSCKYFGVSAQGCDYKDAEDVKRMLLMESFDRPKIKELNNFTNDITSPIIWLTDDTKN